MAPRESSRPRHRDRPSHDGRRRSHARRSEHRSRPTTESTLASPEALSLDSLAKLNQLNEKLSYEDENTPRRPRAHRHRQDGRERERTATRGGARDGTRNREEKTNRARQRDRERDRRRNKRQEYQYADEVVVVETARKQHRRKKRRVVSGALLEEGSGEKLKSLKSGYFERHKLRGGDLDEKRDYEETPKRKKRLWICIGILVLLLAIIIPVAVVESNKHTSNKSSSNSTSSASSSGAPSNYNLAGISESSIPAAAKGTYLDPFSWYDTIDFNVTYTNETVGGLPIMGLNSTWDDSNSANQNTPTLDSDWGSYGDTPARGVNLGGWLSIEPFITPSLFSSYDSKLGIVDEYTLCQHLGASEAKSTLEKHYSSFVTEQTFAEIAAAGLDHVRIQYSYWAVTTYDDDPYVFRVSWRYLLRGIEWARKYGLRVNLDLHGVPGSQNGWNHSGRQGTIGWLNGTDGTLNGQRSLDIHNQLSAFFAQDRYKNIIAFYGLVNEPKMISLTTTTVNNWTVSAYEIVRKNNMNANVVFGDGFLGLDNWQGKLQGYENLVLDVHQYLIFNTAQIPYNHTHKVQYACTDWTSQTVNSMNVATGFGPTLCGEWSQADTDCAEYLGDVGVGARWIGTYNYPDVSTQVLSPVCPTADQGTCTCDPANADASTYSAEYKVFLQMFAEAQMNSFENGWGWFYWTWDTESSTQWSYKQGLAAGILPALAYKPDFNCSTTIPDYSAAGLPENY